MSVVIPPITLIHWTKFFQNAMFEGKDHPIENECRIPDGITVNTTDGQAWCTVTNDHLQLNTSDAVVFHAPDFIDSPENKPAYKGPEQKWVLYSMETPFSSIFRINQDKMNQFDYLASYHRKSAFLFPYYSPEALDVADRPLPTDFVKSKVKGAPVLWIASNCAATNSRQTYIAELMKYIQVDSYGDCLNNKPWPKDKTRPQLMSEYKFYLSVENANCEDYVTEKLFDTLKYSSLPIVDGPQSYDGYLPTSRAAIRMDAYPDPRDLAAYINFLDADDEAYLSYFDYRRKALTEAPMERLDRSFVELWSDQGAHNYHVSWCSICRKMASTWQERQAIPAATEPPKLVESEDGKSVYRDGYLLVDKTCEPVGKWGYARRGPPYDGFQFTPSPRDEFAYAATGQSLTTDDLDTLEASTSVMDNYHVMTFGLILFGMAIVGYIGWLLFQRTNQYRRLAKDAHTAA
ncbi:hypothetical protein DM01DRAFT_1330684 [Hesseltinella vesiculosa]|uniref:Fucosyltransferase n=1 Tax=Hesseltinella vesiculosa TaxID=101127 RepID=A0A1X2GWZ0_9FUNG|nr:hypothetical protein DM01DRAFT_1330684 [Hesseltinella vesiculosa]